MLILNLPPLYKHKSNTLFQYLFVFPYSSYQDQVVPSVRKISNENNNVPNLTILQTISQSKFWLLWTIFLAVTLIQAFVNTYQKSYGMIFITDDFFFTYVGLASNIINGSLRLVWGYMYDLKGFKVILLI